MTLLTLIAKWNGGKVYGAQLRFAKVLDVHPAMLSKWITGKERPSDARIKQMAFALKVPQIVIARLFLRKQDELADIAQRLDRIEKLLRNIAQQK